MGVRIAVASRDGNTVAGHIGKCANWIVFESANGDKVKEVERVDLPKYLVFHHYKDDVQHPLHACSVMIGASAGGSFVDKMKERGIDVILTAETNPLTAATAFLHRTVTPPKSRPVGEIICKIRDTLSI